MCDEYYDLRSSDNFHLFLVDMASKFKGKEKKDLTPLEKDIAEMLAQERVGYLTEKDGKYTR